MDFEEPGHHFKGLTRCTVRPVSEELRIYNPSINNNTNIYGLPTLVLQFHIFTQRDVWRKPPYVPSRIFYLPQCHRTKTKSFNLKLRPSHYTSNDVFYRLLVEILNNSDDYFDEYNDVIIGSVIRNAHKHVDDYLNNGGGGGAICQYLELLVEVNSKLEHILDERLVVVETPSSWNGGMVPASKTPIIQLPERMEIDEDQSLNDHDCAICLEQLGNKEGKKIVCMPCSHMFHGDCITTWLHKSHHCPICRYDTST